MTKHDRDSSDTANGEVDFFLLLEQLWNGKIWIAGCTFFFCLFGFAYLSSKPPESVVYRASISIEIGSFYRDDGTPIAFDNNANFAAVISRSTSVEARPVSGTGTVMDLSVTDAQIDKAKDRIIRAVDFAANRHQVKALPLVRVVFPTRPLGEVTIQEVHSRRPAMAAILITSGVVGLAFGSALLLSINAMLKYRGKRSIGSRGQML